MMQRRSSAPPLGSRLLGTPDESVQLARIRVQALLTVTVVVTNLVGIAVVAVLVVWVVPGPTVLTSEFVWINSIAVPVYVVAALLAGLTWGTRRLTSDLRWATEGSIPDETQQRTAFRAPWRLTRVQIILWGLAFVLFTTVYGLVNPAVIPKVAFTILFAGATVTAFGNLLSQFALRPVAARALEAGGPVRRRSLGVTGRTAVAWVLGTGLPLTGLMLIAVFSFIRPASSAQMAISILAIGSVILCFGLALIVISVRATAAPMRAVQLGMERVAGGDLTASVVVYDATEVGALQGGFNRMAEGLRERDLLRDLFGRHVGEDVARNALERNPELGGEEREVAVLFVDIVGSTTLAATRSPIDVVTLLNRFFAIVVAESDRRGGMVNKFEGDGALVVFGAPSELDDAYGAALATARSMSTRLRADVPECEVGIGVSSGPAVAGNVGANERYEYTVVGDPVNEASRLCDHAKTEVPGAVAASARTVERAGESERAHWRVDGEVLLRGRTEPTGVAAAVT
ncbi:adenylate/guanylate cyclase domain-containing protein [Rhodococcus rhodnii]|uniref:Adenylate cyclase n=2 Tax=Rhodococcus rhodnii TaxID=38312 RepID=R7WSS7_9NOCA|nr:adenylate/guanylate cyclase domain-containing protein [Rhodococcus rhodnii]EOM78317.1 adenylate cyclase [Rhodococcus rhodnii LMG 5362]TXG91623.1 adenylate/guanylate cyclase domain-containing protein [Rhodococcus rhodnii]